MCQTNMSLRYHRLALSHAKNKGEIRPDLALDALACYLAVSARGLNVYAKICPGEHALQEYVSLVLSTLN
jgi:hypothetical protein